MANKAFINLHYLGMFLLMTEGYGYEPHWEYKLEIKTYENLGECNKATPL